MSGAMPACSQANSLPVRPKPVAISSAISSTPCVSQSVAHLLQIVRRVEAHAARALHDGLEDHRRELVAVLSSSASKAAMSAARAAFAEAQPGRGAKSCSRQHAAEQVVHAGHRVADRHRHEGVAVVAAAQRQQAVARRAAPAPASTAAPS